MLVAVLHFASWMATFSQSGDQASATSAPSSALRLLESAVRPGNPAPGDTLTVDLRW